MIYRLLQFDNQRSHSPFSRWRTKEESASILFVARRPETERILSREGLLGFRRRLSMLSIDGVEGTYRIVYRAFLVAFGERIISALTFFSRLYSAIHCSRALILSTGTVASIHPDASPVQK